ncbi:MAG: alpha/beta hydrolase-fold protein [Opitutus sp.]
MNAAFRLPSPQTGNEYHIYVVEPEVGPTSQATPTLLFMDGDDQFSAGVKAYQELRAEKKLPPLLLVGVGYGASYSKPENRRGRDYTPTQHSDEPTSGGADAFLTFLTDTLWPELKRRYSISEHARGIAGHSLGSLLVLHALWKIPPFFTHHLASAPSIWWDNRSILKIARDRFARSSDLAAKLYLSVGERDSPSMTGDLTELEQQLATHPFAGLEVTTQRFPRRNHFNVLSDAFEAGLIALYGPR